MAGNTFLTPSIIAKEALLVLRKNAVMANLVHRDFSEEFVGKVGDTITVRKPATFEAKEFNGSVTTQDATETGVTVKMDKHLDVTFAVTSKQMALDIKDFSQQLLVPAMQAFADKIDKYLIGLEADITARVAHSSGSVAPADIIAARKLLGDAAAPLTDRRFVCGTQAEADLLTSQLFVSAEQVGDNGTALREASLGRKFGFDIYSDQNIGTVDPESGDDYVPSLAFHKNAFALVTRTLEKPLGTDKCAIVNYDGFGLRVVYGYDMATKTDTVSIDILCGVKTLDKNLAAVVADTRSFQ